MYLRVLPNDQTFSDRAPNEIYVVSTCEGPLGPWRPLATLGDMLENDKFSPKMVIFKHVGKGQNVLLELISVLQTIMGDPNNGLDEFLVQTS